MEIIIDKEAADYIKRQSLDNSIKIMARKVTAG